LSRDDFRVAAEEQLPIVDARLYLALFEERFGIPAELFKEYSFFRANAQAIWIVRRGLPLPARPAPYAVGMPFYYYRLRHPRPTTPAALRWGHLATRHVTELDGEQIGPFIGYQDVSHRPDQAAAFSRGYWLVRYRGQLLGVGLATTDDQGRPVFRALTPKYWRLRLDQLAAGSDDDSTTEE
jgi:hypothetical protein